MALAPGTRLGPYEVTAPLGAGGMGEVYRAKDTRLGREVALKLLPEAFAADPERLARFEREARTLASLNHPHIAQIHGLEDASGTPALVMELVEGPTLADRIAEGPLPLDEALPIARQIAEALEAAHDQGIVHRDLKPANVKVRPDGTVKVLDFGLAKAVAGDSGVVAASDAPANSPTITSPAMTMRGVILGTAAYMSPEQAKGKPVDRRADIWAFGCVLFEMLTGRRAFEGEDVSDTLASVLRAEPAWSALPPTVPERVRTLVRRCLQRDVPKRLPHIGVARLELADDAMIEPASSWSVPSPPPRSSWRTHAAWAAILAAVLAGAAWRSAGQATARRPPIWFSLLPPAGHVFPGAAGVPRFAISPDGTALVFAASEPGVRDQLFVRRLGELDAAPIRGTEAPQAGGDAIQGPLFSPDGRYLVFFSGAESLMKRVPVAGGPVETLARLPATNVSGTWAGDVILVASQDSAGVQRIPAAGGEPTPVTTLDRERGEIVHLWPQFLPGGEQFIYLARTDTENAVYVGFLDGQPPRRVVSSQAMARFAPPDRLLYVRDSALVEQPFDLERLALVGEPAVVVDPVMYAPNTRVGVATSDSGVLVVAEGNGGEGNFQLVRKNRRGERMEPAVVAANLLEPYVRLSPDGRSVAFQRMGRFGEVWIKDLIRGVESRVSAQSQGSNRIPVWSADGRRLMYQSNRDAGSRTALYVRDIAALQPETRVYLSEGASQVLPDDWSPDGEAVLVRELGGVRGTNLVVLRANGAEPPVVYRGDGAINRQGTFAPDGRWVAYASNEAGPQQQIFVRSFPDPAVRKIQVSADGGGQPRWRRDGRELFYVNAKLQLVGVSVTYGPDGSQQFAAPEILFSLDAPGLISGGGPSGSVYDPAPDGQSFIVVERFAFETTRLTVAVDWMSEQRR